MTVREVQANAIVLGDKISSYRPTITSLLSLASFGTNLTEHGPAQRTAATVNEREFEDVALTHLAACCKLRESTVGTTSRKSLSGQLAKFVAGGAESEKQNMA